MSFILDALKKAETQRVRAPSAPTGEAPLSQMSQQTARPTSNAAVLVATISGLAIVAAIAWWLGRQSGTGTAAITLPSPTTTPPQVAARLPVSDGKREVRKLDQEARPRVTAAPVAQQDPQAAAGSRAQGLTATAQPNPGASFPAPVGASGSAPATATAEPASNIQLPAAVAARQREQLPAYDELALSGRVQLPNFHLDVHVFSENAARRFVFVNKRKYREGEKLDEGGRVESITPVGAVINYQGHRFELVPD